MDKRIAGLIALLGMAGPVVGQTLQEKIAAARAAAAERAAAEAKEKGLGKSAARLDDYDPKTDPGMWRIQEFHIPSNKMFGMTVAGGDEARFYAEVPRTDIPESLPAETLLYFYEWDAGKLRLAGRGKFQKKRGKHRTVVVEASLDAFRWAKLMTRKTPTFFGLPTAQSGTKVLQLTDGKRVDREHWYMSTELRGPDVAGWSLEEIEKFALGTPWKGMSERALLATLGPPDKQFRHEGRASMVWGEGNASRKFVVEGDRVTDMSVGDY